MITEITEHCYHKLQGALGFQGPWSMVMRGAMEHCDDRVHGAL